MTRRFAALALPVCLAIAAAGCGESTTTVDVFAASSLTDAFTELETRFEAENPDIDIRLNLAGSDTLRRQIADGADAHVFAPAAIDLFDGLSSADTAVDPIPYATNQLEIIAIDDDIANRVAAGDMNGLLVARCADGVPCGRAADQLIAALGLDVSDATVTAEANVRAVSAKVMLGEADVGLVYRTDAIAAGEEVVATGITSPEASVVLALAAIDSGNADAQAFVDFVIAQQELFRELGFSSAP